MPRMKKMGIAVLAAGTLVAGLSGCSSGNDAPEAFTTKATVTLTPSGIDNLVASAADCQTIKTTTGRWDSTSPVIFKQDGAEVGTATITTRIEKIDSSLARDCKFTFSSTLTPTSSADITAELPDGFEWTLPISEWQDSPSMKAEAAD